MWWLSLGLLEWLVLFALQQKRWGLPPHPERGGGSKPQPPTFIQPPPPQVTQLPPPNVGETSKQLFQSQLEYNPQLTAQQVELQGQYGPQLAQQQYELQKQYGPLYRSIYEQMFPSQTQGMETLAQQALQRLRSPYSLTPEQQTAQDAIRNRQRDELSRAIRTRANLGGTLYGGRAEEQEIRAQAELANQYATADIGLQQQSRDQLLRELIASGQVIFPQVQQPNVPSYGQGVTPSPDALLGAMSNNYIVNPAQLVQGTPGTPGMGGPLIGAAGGLGAAKIFVMCLPGNVGVDTPHGPVPVSELRAGDEVSTGRVLFKNEYAPQETLFVKLTLEDGRSVETCDLHCVEGRPAHLYDAGTPLAGSQVKEKDLSIRTERTYDLLTDSQDGGYAVQGIRVATMIPALHRVAKTLEGFHVNRA